ncbi:MAG TPA: hypothetical protein VM346_03060 [Sphingomicrobium sp.]|nr:hypothetical protein [Sphingomicrobium sp.]
MNRTSKFAAAFALACVTMTAPAHAEKPVELSAAELVAAQSRTYSVPPEVAIAASIAALQSLAYVDITASKDAGTISAHTEAKGKIIYNILWGVGKKKLTQKASILVEDAGAAQSLIRLNLHVSETKQRGLWAASFTDGKLVKVAEPYASFFAALDAEIARRAAVAVPTVSAAGATSTDAAVPASSTD